MKTVTLVASEAHKHIQGWREKFSCRDLRSRKYLINLLIFRLLMSSTKEPLGSIMLPPLELFRAGTVNSIARKFQALATWTGRHSQPPEDTLTTGSRSTPLWSQETEIISFRLSTPEARCGLGMKWVHRTLTSTVLAEHMTREVVHFTGAASRLKQNWLLRCRRWVHPSISTSSKGPRTCWKRSSRRPPKTWNGLILSLKNNGESRLFAATNLAMPGLTGKTMLQAPMTPSWMRLCQYQNLTESPMPASTWEAVTTTSQSCNEPWTCWSNKIRPTGLGTTQVMGQLSTAMTVHVNSRRIIHICSKPKDPSVQRRSLMFPNSWERSRRNERPKGNHLANINGARTLAMTTCCKYSLRASEKSSKEMMKELSRTLKS